MAAKPRKRQLTPGRLRKYRSDFCQRAMAACLLGATNSELATIFDVTRRAIDYWLAEKPEFAAAVKAGREVADEAVANALYRKALDGDTTAMIFWLKNRRPDRWRDKHEVQQTSDVRHSGRVEHVLSEEARRWINEDLEEMGVPLIEPPAKPNGKSLPSGSDPRGNGKGKAGGH